MAVLTSLQIKEVEKIDKKLVIAVAGLFDNVSLSDITERLLLMLHDITYNSDPEEEYTDEFLKDVSFTVHDLIVNLAKLNEGVSNRQFWLQSKSPEVAAAEPVAAQ